MKANRSPKRKVGRLPSRIRRPVLNCILVPLDFSSGSQRALEYAAMLANHSGASLQLLHVMDKGFYGSDVAYLYYDVVKTRLNAHLQMQRILKRLKGLRCEAHLSEGTPHKEIISVARELGADLIVMGSHGYTGLTRFLLGSTAERVVRHAKCPVLVVRTRERKSRTQGKRSTAKTNRARRIPHKKRHGVTYD